METITATPEAPAAPIVAAPVAPVTEPAINLENVSDRLSLSRDQRRGALFGQNKTAESPVAATPVTPEPAPVETPAEVTIPAEVPPVEAPPVVPATPVEPADDAIDPAGFAKNFRVHTDDPTQSAFLKAYKAALAVNPRVNPADVARLVGLEAAPVAQQSIPGIETAPPQPPAEIVAARAEIEAMIAKIDEAAGEGVLFTPELAKLNRELAAKQASLAKTELRYELNAERQAREQSQTSQQNAHATRQEEMAATEAEFPTLLDPDSDLTLELDRQFGLIASNPQHPDFQKVNKPGFPAYLTQQSVAAVVARTMKKNPGMTEAQALAAVKGAKPAEAPRSPAVVPAKPAAQPVPRTVLVTSPGGQQAPAPVQLSIEQIRAEAAKDPAFRRRALGFSDTRMVG